MQFRAILKRSSTVYRHWTASHRTSGKVSGVRFRKVGRDYVSAEDPLPPDHVSALLRNNAVELEMTTALAGDVATESQSDDTGQEGQAGENGAESQTDDEQTGGEQIDQDGEGEADSGEPDSLAALFRNGVPKSDAEQGQEPVMRRRGRQPGPR